MGAVYKARQPGLDRLVAVKILPPQLASDPAFAERFTREARAMAKLSHPNIAAVFDFGQVDGLYYFVMEFVDGVNLRETMRADKLRPQEALAIVPQICDALQFAHDEGVVHRDIKPENILLDQKGRVKIVDFGLAKLLGQAPADFTLTGAHQAMGTPHYMAPEQIERPLEVDHRADIYSLGVVFYEMLTGELPIGRFAPPSKKVQVDVRLDEVVLRALEKEPERRYQHVSEVKTDMESVAAGFRVARQPAEVTDVSIRDAGWQPAPRFSGKAILGAAWAAFFAAGAALYSVGIPVFPTLTNDGPQPWQWVLIFTLLPLGATAPFGTTILGAVSLSEIRHSRGRLIGLPLALADVLLFPLLLLDLLIYWVCQTLVLSIGFAYPLSLAFPVALLICVVVDFLIVLWAWRRAVRDPRVEEGWESRAVKAAAKGPQGMLTKPVIGLWLAACFDFFAALLCLSQLSDAFHYSFSREPDVPFVAVATYAVIAVAGLTVASVQVLAFVNMMRLQSHRLAMAGTVLAMITPPGLVIGLPAGIWALEVLTRREVKQAFAPAPPLRRSTRSLLAASIWTIVLLLVCIGLHAGLRPFDRYAPVSYTISDEPTRLEPQSGAYKYIDAISSSKGQTSGYLAPVESLPRQQLTFTLYREPDLGQIEIDLGTLGYRYWDQEGIEVAAESGLSEEVLLQWISSAGVDSSGREWATKVAIAFRFAQVEAEEEVQRPSNATFFSFLPYSNPNIGWRVADEERLVYGLYTPSGDRPQVSGKIEIALETLGYGYRDREGREVSSDSGLSKDVLLEWLKSAGVGTATAAVRAEAANLLEIAKGASGQRPLELANPLAFTASQDTDFDGRSWNREVTIDPWVTPAVGAFWLIVWLGGCGLCVLRAGRKTRKGTEDAAAEKTQRQVKLPAIGLMVVGIINCLCLVALGAMVVWQVPVPSGFRDEFVAAWLIVSGLLGVPILFGAIKMRQLEGYEMATLAAFVAILPVTPGAVLGVPIGIWALAVLTQREVKAAFARRKGAAAGAPQQAQRLAAGLLVAGIVNWLAAIGLMVGIWTEPSKAFFRYPFDLQVTAVIGEVGVFAAGLLIGGFMVVAALSMGRLQSYRLVVTGTVLGMIVPPGCLIGLPVGIWALAVLSRQEVKDAFKEGRPLDWRLKGTLRVLIWTMFVSLAAVAVHEGLEPYEHYAPADYTVTDAAQLQPRSAAYKHIVAITSGEGRTYGCRPGPDTLPRQQLKLELHGTVRGWITIDLGTLGYRYAGRQDDEVSGDSGLDEQVLLEWMNSAGVDTTTGENRYLAAYFLRQAKTAAEKGARAVSTGSTKTFPRSKAYLIHIASTGSTDQQQIRIALLAYPGGTFVSGEMQINLEMLGYRYRDREGREVSGDSGLTKEMLIEWMKSAGVDTDTAAVRVEAANLLEMAKGAAGQTPLELANPVAFVASPSYGYVRKVTPDKWIVPAVCAFWAILWLGGCGLLVVRAGRKTRS